MRSFNVFSIRVKDYLEEEWEDWFDGMSISHGENSETILTGPVVDQASLFGLLLKVNSLNLTLLSVNIISKED
jgi:hypothetical protein